jgi:peptidoglycan/xylan/chitin deacetylase (PgdA/CDA1 family)
MDDPGRLVPVLLYHSVTDEARPGFERWTVGTSAFDAHVEAVARSGRSPVTVSELAAGLRGERPLPARPVAVTFDDGFHDTVRALDRLAEASIGATVYATASYVGRPGMMSADDVASIAPRRHVEVGAHGMTHRRLDELREDEIADEVTTSRAFVESMTGRACETFAYPHGCHDRRVVAAVRRSGYTSAVAVKNALSHRDDDPLAIARVTVSADTTVSDIEHVLDGDWRVVRPGQRLRTRGYRVARRLERRVREARKVAP